MSDHASSSLTALVVVLVCVILSSAAALAVGAMTSETARATARQSARAACDAALADWISLYHRGAGEVDSPFEAYAVSMVLDGATVVPEDVSSRINMAWVRPDLIGSVNLSPYFRPGVSSDLRQYREGSGPIEGKAVNPLLTSDAARTILTDYSYADLNTSDAQAIEKLYAARTDDVGRAHTLRAFIAAEASSYHRITPGDLSTILDPHFGEVFPVICVAPPYNVNFAPIEIIQAVLALPEVGIVDFADRAKALVNARASGRVTMNRLYVILGVPKENSVYDYLGAATWFWKLTIEAQGTTLGAIVARIPPFPGYELKAEKEPELRLVSRRFL
ncbi:MAG TPA: hypothetical protein VMV83_01375 [Rectinemataceae bacterium]|nr:hypothetical protein [Rectinemataceae bacterium]